MVTLIDPLNAHPFDPRPPATAPQATPQTAPQGRLTLQTHTIALDTIALRCLDWDRERFDIEFELKNGTTYNSFLIQGKKTALIDTSHRKFQALYCDYLDTLLDLSRFDYLIVSHTEPDHSGLIGDILALAPDVTIVGSKVAIQFLENMVHRPFTHRIVKQGDCLELGKGHTLEFISAPNLHWPDTILTYDAGTQVLYTCDVFGMHYCDDCLVDQVPEMLAADFQYYYDCLMGPNARSVLAALKRIEPLTICLIATGHGPLLQHHILTWLDRYRTWSQALVATETYVVLFYMEDYGYSDRLAQAIAHGIARTGVGVEFVEMGDTHPHDVREILSRAAGFVIGMPPQVSGATAHPILSTIATTASPKQAFGLFESGAGQDEPLYPFRNQLREMGLTEAFPPILLKTAPTEATDQLCDEAGTDLGQWLNRDRTVKQMKAVNSDLEKALGRLSNGLYLLTARKGKVTGAMLASWVIQSSFKPLGVTIAVANDRAIESLLQVGDRFVLNVLEEGNYQGLMKHFLKRFPPGADRFAGINTCTASNGSPILAEALAYLECEVTSRMACSDHWLVYCQVQAGRVAKPDGLTAVHHRKVGNHY
ncbi:diflavin flavoprotein [Trichothermofontia sp.]